MKKILPLVIIYILTSCTGATQITEPTATVAPLPSPIVTRAVPTAEPVIDVGASPEAIKGTEMEFWFALSGDQAALMEQNIASFSLSNPYGVEVLSKRFNTLYELQHALLAAEGSPDAILWFAGDPLPEGFDSIDISPYTKLNDVGVDAEKFLSGVPQAGMPFIRSARFLVYNTSFARELGFSTLPTTFDEFKEQVCAANAYWRGDDDQTNDGFGGYLFDGEANWQDPLTWMINQDQGSDASEPLIGGQETLLWLEELRADGCAWYMPDVNKYEQLRDRKTLVISVDAHDLAEVDGAKLMYAITDELDVGGYPGKFSALIYGFDFYVNKTDPRTQLAAYLFARWLNEDAQQIEWVKEAGLLPVTSTSVEKLAADTTLPTWQLKALALLPKAGSLVDHPELSANRILIGDGFYQWVTRYPYTSIEEVWSEISP